MPLRWASASNNLGRVCKRAGIPHLSPKDLRRTASSWMMADGIPQTLISRWMRHANDTMVRTTYGQLTADELGALIKAARRTPASQSEERTEESCVAGETNQQERCCGDGVQGRNRTSDTRIFNAVTVGRGGRYSGFRCRSGAPTDTSRPDLTRRGIRVGTRASQSAGYWAGRRAA
jgi:hypothetical protein